MIGDLLLIVVIIINIEKEIVESMIHFFKISWSIESKKKSIYLK